MRWYKKLSVVTMEITIFYLSQIQVQIKRKRSIKDFVYVIYLDSQNIAEQATSNLLIIKRLKDHRKIICSFLHCLCFLFVIKLIILTFFDHNLGKVKIISTSKAKYITANNKYFYFGYDNAKNVTEKKCKTFIFQRTSRF